MFYFRVVDPYNLTKRRNMDNTQMNRYNCGGYALFSYSWFCPYDRYEVSDWCGFQDRTWEEMEHLTTKCVNFMLKDVPGLRLINTLEDIIDGEYGIAFRISSDGDFHYMRQDSGEVWSHKRGGGPIYVTTVKEVLSECWCHRYDGPLVLFAKKRL